MTNKLKIAEQAKRIIVGGHPTDDAEVNIRELLLYVSQSLAAVVRRRFFELKQIEGEEYVNGDLLFSFKNIEVNYDDDFDLYYSDLPATTIDLPRNMGVFHVSLMKEQDNVFLPLPNQFNSLYRGLGADDLEGRQGFYVEYGKIYFPKMNAQSETCKVLIKMIAPVGSIDECDDFPLPEDLQQEVVTMTVNFYLNQQKFPKDITNDNLK